MEINNQTYYNWPMNMKTGHKGTLFDLCLWAGGRTVYAEQWRSQKNNVQKFVISTVAESK